MLTIKTFEEINFNDEATQKELYSIFINSLLVAKGECEGNSMSDNFLNPPIKTLINVKYPDMVNSIELNGLVDEYLE